MRPGTGTCDDCLRPNARSIAAAMGHCFRLVEVSHRSILDCHEVTLSRLKSELAWRDKRIAELEARLARPICERCELDRDGFGFQGMLPEHTCSPEDHI